ncbi:short-chain dehydrogenase [Altererythrobacter sp. B11]|uniref:SDR family NAD(P)-dependent oxidoreductase n=1 Tax=Altererythrobacter sp. B11 TaxID=2060312 RepID=UPI000DC6E5A8|nr:SDR family NAD(P)-dependent oxidoreductase [Altererythrobacter sp. B11]BBC72549.1 short-chain dehydrogenase [Altererythrobacter sp. B11]
MRDLAGKGAFITGGASGIGLGMAKAFAQVGMKVCIADIRQDHLDQAQEELAAAGLAGRVEAMLLDVTNRQAYAAAADEVEARCGRLHVLCNNAGIGILKSLGNADYADWDWAVDVNLNGVFNGIHALLPRIRAHGEGGHIVNTASMAGVLQYSQAGLYVATKFAVVGLSEALRAELAPEGIGVSAFCPGGVRSNIREYEKTRPARFAAEGAEAKGPPPRFNLSEADRERLGRLTATPEEAGEMVLQGIRDNALYIFTAPEFRPGIVDRFQAMLRALGEDSERERTALELIPGLVGSPIYREAP